MNRVEIPFSKKKMSIFLITFILLIVFGIWLTTSNNEDLALVGGFLIVISSAAAALFLWKLFDKKLALIVDNEGIIISPKSKYETKLLWSEIDSFSEFSIHGTKMISINLKNPKSFMDNEKGVIMHSMMKLNMDVSGTLYNLCANIYKISHKELLDLLNRYKDNA